MQPILNLILMIVSTSIFTIDQETKKSTAIRNMCIERNGLNATHLRNLNPIDAREYVTLEKWTCIIACILERDAATEQSLYNIILDRIETGIKGQLQAISSPSIAFNKEQLIETLDNCKRQVGERDCNLLNCIKIWEPPLPSVLHIPSYY